jgi:hypothetical protein
LIDDPENMLSAVLAIAKLDDIDLDTSVATVARDESLVISDAAVLKPGIQDLISFVGAVEPGDSFVLDMLNPNLL